MGEKEETMHESENATECCKALHSKCGVLTVLTKLTALNSEQNWAYQHSATERGGAY